MQVLDALHEGHDVLLDGLRYGTHDSLLHGFCDRLPDGLPHLVLVHRRATEQPAGLGTNAPDLGEPPPCAPCETMAADCISCGGSVPSGLVVVAEATIQ